MTTFKQNIILSLLLPILGFGIWWSGQDANQHVEVFTEEYEHLSVVTVPTTEYYKLTSFGFTGLRSSILWLECVQYLGDYLMNQYFGNQKQDMSELGNYLERITDLDPYFVFPFKTAALVLADTNAKQAIAIMEKGAKNNKQDWEIPYYLGYIYMFVQEDLDKSALYFEQASTMDGVLSSAHTLTRLAKQRAGKLEQALTMWSDEYENASNEVDQNRAYQKMIDIQQIIDSITLLRNSIANGTLDKENINLSALQENKTITLPEQPAALIYAWNEEKQTIDIQNKYQY
jgi:hypothetical protein